MFPIASPFVPALARVLVPERHGLREKTHVWKSGRSVAETRTRSAFWVYMTYRDLVMAALSWWQLVCVERAP